MRADLRAPLAAALLAIVGCEEQTHSLGLGRPQTEDGAVPSEPTFREPVAIAALRAPDASDDDPALNDALTVLVFNSTRAGGMGQEDIWASSRSRRELAWGAPEPLRELNTEARETGIALSGDGLTVWFSSDREGGEGGLDVYVARRTSLTAPFSSPLHVSSLSSEGDDLISAVDGAQQLAYLARRDDEDSDYDLFLARRASADGEFESAEPIPELNTDDDESDASPLSAGALLFTRDGELLLARRTQTDGSYDLVEELEQLNSDEDERDGWASSDLSYVVFSSDRSGAHQLYESQR